MLTPQYMLKGIIRTVKEVRLSDVYIERHYRDEYGNQSVVVMVDLKEELISINPA